MTEPTKCYSRDEEQFYDDMNDVLSMLDSDGELEPGAVIYEGEKVEKKPSDFAPGADDIMEHLAEQAWDHASEFAEGWPHDPMPKEKQAELEKLLHDWLDANLNVTFWTVKDIRKVELTEADIADYRGEPAPSSTAASGVSVPDASVPDGDRP